MRDVNITKKGKSGKRSGAVRVRMSENETNNGTKIVGNARRRKRNNYRRNEKDEEKKRRGEGRKSCSSWCPSELRRNWQSA